ncbi:hypothetical protein KCU65_g447, partial [Aureobasidium melanogenum]
MLDYCFNTSLQRLWICTVRLLFVLRGLPAKNARLQQRTRSDQFPEFAERSLILVTLGISGFGRVEGTEVGGRQASARQPGVSDEGDLQGPRITH